MMKVILCVQCYFNVSVMTEVKWMKVSFVCAVLLQSECGD